HEEAVQLCARHGKAVLCTKPLARNADEAKRILDTVERAGIFAGYLEDLVYTPKTLKALKAVQAGQIGDVTWARSRETHPGPHSAWFWDASQAGGGAIVDLGCHCTEIVRNYVGKDNRPVDVMCWLDTLVHPIEAEDNAIALIRFASGAIGQFEVSWTFRGGMDLRDEVAGTEGTIFTNHFLRTGFELFSSGEGAGYVAEKAETTSGWMFPVGDEMAELGYVDMFADMFDAMDAGREPMETFYDGYVVNAIMDACYRSGESRRWEPVELVDWRGGKVGRIAPTRREWDGKTLIKQEQMPDGRLKLIVKDEATGEFADVVTEAEPASTP
ncbi:MAG TPA: Gfo/Idh/MocA family oxidoreductase, partial [Gaiellaceae bacterium]|nr:Gfo/Idh/MocA family oxidoreductase [Gaiellaceae bacterium]